MRRLFEFKVFNSPINLTPSQIEIILSMVRECLENRFKCDNLSGVVLTNGLADAGRLD